MYTTMTFSNQTQITQPQVAWPLNPNQYLPAEHCVLAKPSSMPHKTVTVSRMYKPVALSQLSNVYNPELPLVDAIEIYPPRPVMQMYDCRTGTQMLFVNNI